ncbi:phosphotransferase [Rhizobium laguerreae]|uniref:Hydroxylysine kinase n=1 Tax=Rhizobium laguerreae TaxID=1076926 RepID=A0AB35FFI8_9HYPH|nr:phosphotransferase [Rhizobium laguerreae]MBY3064748.1 phosphotransferase [Rhizobium laguerreae]
MSSAPKIQSADQDAFSGKVETTPLDTVALISAEYFGISGRAATLSSERDETFLVHGDDGRQYVLKIANQAERMDVLAFQMQGLQHLALKNLPVPLPFVVPANDGATLLSLALGGEQRIVRMLTFLDGVQLHRAERSPRQMQSLGTTLALLGVGLADFRPAVPKQDLLWDICNAECLRALVPHVEASRQGMVQAALDGFERLAAGEMSNLPRQVIHNDFNPHNILVSAGDAACVTGLIDFGDMVEAPLINDVAVALSYQIGAANGLADTISMLRAYHAVRPLDPLELACLPVLLRTRLAMTIIITEWRAGLYPENRDYILRNHPIALAGLLRLADHPDADLGAFFRQNLGEFK